MGWSSFAKWATTPEWTKLSFSPEVKSLAGSSMKSWGNGMGKVMKGGGKLALAGAAVVGGIYAASSIVDSFRSKNEYQEPPKQPMQDPFADLPPMPPMYEMAGPQQDTMMGLAPVEGKFAQQVNSRRAMAQGAGPEVG